MREQLSLPFDAMPTRWELEAEQSSTGDGRRWHLGDRCIDLRWPWWRPWQLEELWPNGNARSC